MEPPTTKEPEGSPWAVLFWVILVPMMCFTFGLVTGKEEHKQLCVDKGVAEWRVNKRGTVEFHFKGVQNVGQAK
jgi:hypothetical protein